MGSNVYVKVPVTDTWGKSTAAVVRELSNSGVHLNVTALMTVPQVEVVTSAVAGGSGAIICCSPVGGGHWPGPIR